ncbi:MAG: hypothetical protein NTY66_01335 [Candidatus Vogelbacteria bacterium]|nr:hypothetical protein [Candidatus Vogelbacteria bacterium]
MLSSLAQSTFFILILTAVAFESLADIFFKKWGMSASGHTAFLVAGFVIYAISTIAWAVSLKYGYLTKAISIFTILNFIIVILVGVFLFKENLSLVNKLGIVLGIASVILMEI